jgi:hypothetical protein
MSPLSPLFTDSSNPTPQRLGNERHAGAYAAAARSTTIAAWLVRASFAKITPWVIK